MDKQVPVTTPFYNLNGVVCYTFDLAIRAKYNELKQGEALKQSLESYIKFHTAENLSAYGIDEISDFNICCEAKGNDEYLVYFLFA